MSETHLVNRVTSPFMELEGQKLAAVEKSIAQVEKGTLDGSPVEESIQVNSAVPTQAFDAQTTEAHRAGQVGKVEEPKNLEFLAEAVRNFTLPEDRRLTEFKKQVIAAFKHMGVDTRKFFGV